jgi:adenosine deaminase
MRHQTLLDLADARGHRLPGRLADPTPLHLDLPADRRGWTRFQALYEIARAQVDSAAVFDRLMAEMCADEAAEGSGWVELQIDPSGYVAAFGGLHEALDALLSAAAAASAASGVGVGVVVAANRTRHSQSAATLARLAAQYAPGHRSGREAAGAGIVPVVGFGLSNNEVWGPASEFVQAFRIAHAAGLSAVPHAGELAGPESVRQSIELLGATRVGHGVRASEDPSVLALMAERGVAAEVCPSSNLALGVYHSQESVPLGALLAAGVPVALGADDPLLFGARLGAQYRAARAVHGIDDAGLAGLARDSVRASLAPADRKAALASGIDAWLRAPGDGPGRASSRP